MINLFIVSAIDGMENIVKEKVMDYRRQQISIHQFTVLLIIYIVGDAILILPSIIAAEAKKDAWIAAIFSLFIGMIIVYFIYGVSKHYPNLTIIEYNKKVMGKVFGSLISLLYLSYSFLYAAVALREVGDFLTTEILPDTPIEAIHILFALIVIMATRLGLENIARCLEILYPYVFLLFFILVISLIPQINFENVQPVLEDGFKPVARASLTFITYPFVELVIFMMFLPYINEKARIKKYFFGGALIGGLILVLFTTLTILVLGYEQTSRYMYPGYSLAKKINVGAFFSRVEVILAGIWFITIFLRITIYFYFTCLGLAQILNLKDYRPFVYPLGMIMVVLSISISPNIVYINEMSSIWPFYDLTIGVFLPLLLVLITFIRKKLNSF
ncbi:spore germination protein KB [Metabacillus crassostreae]|uniref:GerAB/ArcD/ProY family transporter n=1 Tax=Metabacillus crassostreae TaxID=929098 RepID=UPI001EF75643|nr:endospore germination permease [Metabacillus crassostreae]MBM7602411.1 spore germination protein KB [Metabacillus crassostreae]